MVSEKTLASWRYFCVARNKIFRRGAKRLGVPADLIAYHDYSEVTDVEFTSYASMFIDGIDDGSFDEAFLHHIHNNKHHWQHWVLHPGRPVEMPYVYIAEMVADWMSFVYMSTGSCDLTYALNELLHDIVMCDVSKIILFYMLEHLGHGNMQCVADLNVGIKISRALENWVPACGDNICYYYHKEGYKYVNTGVIRWVGADGQTVKVRDHNRLIPIDRCTPVTVEN